MFIHNTLVSFFFLLVVALGSKLIALATFTQLPIELFSTQSVEAIFFGLRFDATISAMLTALIFLLSIPLLLIKFDSRRWMKGVLSLFVFWIVATTFSDAIYAKDASKHVTFELFTADGMENELLITALRSYWGTFGIGMLWLILCQYILWTKITFSNHRHHAWYTNTSFGVVWLLCTVTLIRGGWSDAPQTPMRAYNIGNSEQAFIAWSAPYSITYYLSNGDRAAIKKITKDPSQEQLAQWQEALQTGREAQLEKLKQANVVMILLESWPAYDMQSYAGVANATPFFDELRQRSLTTDSSYADGYRTVQGMFATFCSYPNPTSGIISTSQLQNAQYVCLPHILRQQGWQTTFIQGSAKGKVGSFAQTLGFAESFGKHDYPFEAKHNEWGYMDNDIYRYSLQQIERLSQSPQPFFITINTGTTHGAYLPEEDGYAFGRDNQINERRSVMKHADQSLRQFIPQLDAKLAILDKPTLVVLVADHTAKTVKGGFVKNAIPLAIYSSDQSLPAKHLPITASQRDVGATILDWLGGYAPWFTGHSLLDSNYSGRASFAFGTGFFWMTKEHGIAINVETGELAQCFEIGQDRVTKHTVPCDTQPWAQTLFNEANYYNTISQYLLFKGRSTDYRSRPVSE
ncbi:LTA synthase family protein [Vibrio vulnificus]|nr:LTA synthase family protein [Vibrio vulnificus]POC05766.1 phosphoglycerol transferase [Vibrio vulnificus]HAS8109174.1 LTA synthase family protein [Vibrio vulnificus]HAS8158895.1 LTA synthase family protein [Vibrio vulnificus]HAS8302955.1 LTA synthase family protein [Vibrio vulnificus]